MSRCLSDRALFSLHEDEETISERSHLDTCEACSKKYEQVGLDIGVVRRVLRQEPPPQMADRRPRVYATRWLPAAAAVALALVLVWGGLWLRSPSAPELAGNAQRDDIWSLLEEISTDLFLLEDAMAEDTWSQAADLRAISVTLGEESPCAWENPSAWDPMEADGGTSDESGGGAFSTC